MWQLVFEGLKWSGEEDKDGGRGRGEFVGCRPTDPDAEAWSVYWYRRREDDTDDTNIEYLVRRGEDYPAAKKLYAAAKRKGRTSPHT